ncbi:unnamed protein product [Mesocestoides corti]|nr:unnamed protein product [Mesocestoides corti]
MDLMGAFFLFAAIVNIILTIEHAYTASRRRLSFLILLNLLQNLLNTTACFAVFFTIRAKTQQPSEWECYLIASFAIFWFVFSLRAWTNVFVCTSHYLRILRPRSSGNLKRLFTYGVLILTASMSSLASALIHVFMYEFEEEYGVCSAVFLYEDELAHRRFMRVRVSFVASVALNYLLPIIVVSFIYSELLTTLKSVNAPKKVIRDIEELLLLDKHLYLWLVGPIHSLMALQFIFLMKEFPNY